MPLRVPARDPYRPLRIDDFGFGLLTRDSIISVPPGAARVSRNCDYESRNLANRKGYARVLENGPGAVNIADFETDESWSGGSPNTTSGEFIVNEPDATGAQSLNLSASAGATNSIILTIASADFGTDPLEVFNLWIRPSVIPSTIETGIITLEFEDSSANLASHILAQYEKTVAVSEVLRMEDLAPRYHRFRRKQFTLTGDIDWTDIVLIRIKLQAIGTSGTLPMTFDNMHRTPGKIQDLFQYERQEGVFQGSRDEYCIARGNLYHNDRKRWTQIFTGFRTDGKPVYSLSTSDRRLISDGSTSPRQLMPDGATVHRLGIVTPPRQIVATETTPGVDPDGQLSGGDYFVQVLYFSSTTGSFSAPDERVPETPSLTITSETGKAGINFSNIPVSSDPQVDWVIIAIRPETEPNLFLRASDGIFGEVPNGTTTFQFLGSVSELLTRSASAIDPDLDYPSVIDGDTNLPVEAHPTFMRELGGYVISVFSEQPTVVRISRFRSPGSWQIDDEIPVGENDSDALTGLATLSSTLFAMKRNAVYYGRVVGGDTKLLIEGPFSDRGTVDHKSMRAVGDVVFYRGQDGIYMVRSDIIPRIVTAAQLPTWKHLWDPAGYGEGAAVVVRDREQVIHFGRELKEDTNGIGWVTHYRTVLDASRKARRSKWPDWAATLHTIPSDVAAEVETDQGFESWTGGMGQVWRINHGHTDDARRIEMVHRTPLIALDPRFVSLWKWLDIEAQVSGSFNLDVDVLFGPAAIPDDTPQANMKGLSSPLGEFVLGTSRLGAPQYLNERLKLPRIAARYAQFELRFTSKVALEVRSITPWLMLLGNRRANR